MTLEDGSLFEIHGDEHNGFEIRKQGRQLPTRFKNIDQAQMAIDMFRNHMRKKDQSQDYLEEK